jgi:hypothetical protein
MDVFYAYTFGTAGWLALQAAPLIISPTIMVTMLSPEVREPSGKHASESSDVHSDTQQHLRIISLVLLA